MTFFTNNLFLQAKNAQLRAITVRREACRNRKTAQKQVDVIEIEEREDGPAVRSSDMIEMEETPEEAPSLSELCYPKRPLSYLRDKNFGVSSGTIFLPWRRNNTIRDSEEILDFCRKRFNHLRTR